MSLGIGLCVNQTRAVLEALAGRETEFVRTPKHGVRGKLEAWSNKKYRAAKSITPFIELGFAAYFLLTMAVAFDHGHYLSMPFLGLFLAGFGYVGAVSVWQGDVGARLRAGVARLRGRHEEVEVGVGGVRFVAPPVFARPGSATSVSGAGASGRASSSLAIEERGDLLSRARSTTATSMAAITDRQPTLS
jgi:hypothetical protein